MESRDWTDVIAGSALFVAGALAAGYAYLVLPLGNIERMGPGLFPAAIGTVLAILGAAIAVAPGLRQEQAKPNWRPFFTIPASIFCFAVVMPNFGLIPAVVATVAVASRADGKLSFANLVMLSAVLTGFSYIIFRTLLDLPLPIMTWPG